MILNNFIIKNIGPFINTRIEIEPDVTILTGSNDVGKSQIISILNKTFEKSESC